jgi:hypothetical protein
LKHQEHDFHFDIELDAFEKAGGGERERRIGGFASTADLDADQEVLLQQGLNFKPFLEKGWFNDNHGQSISDVVGYPEEARLVKAGERLPSGKVADRNGWYVEGYLLKGKKKAEDIWETALSLRGTGRALGYSVEGKVTKRLEKAGQKVVAEALVKNVAITHCPKNTRTELEVLAKSLAVGPATGAAVPAGVSLSGVGAGAVLAPESHEGVCSCGKKHDAKKCPKRALTKSEALEVIHQRFPHISRAEALRALAVVKSRSNRAA